MEDHKLCHLEDMSRDLARNILSRLQGKELASVACTCFDLNVSTQDQSLWKHLCHATWPSTALDGSEFPIGFRQFYAKSFPLIIYDKDPIKFINVQSQASSPCDLVSFVDVYLNNKCVLSRTMYGIPQAVDFRQDHRLKDGDLDLASDESQRWFLGCPFWLDLLEQNNHSEEVGVTGYLPWKDHSKELTKSLRLSWILMDKKSGNVVNLSSWKPMAIQRNWPHNGNYLVQFGCIVKVEETVLPHKLAKCNITTRFKISGEIIDGSLKWREISLGIENLEGVHLNGERSLKVLNQALGSSRSVDHLMVEKGFDKYGRERNAMFKKKESREKLAVGIYIFIELVVFVFSFTYSIKLLF